MSDSLSLWKTLYEAGWQSCSTLDSTLKTINHLDINEDDVARALGMMVRTQSTEGQGKTWNITHFVHAVNMKVTTILWYFYELKLMTCFYFVLSLE
jgi:hypothetical protein